MKKENTLYKLVNVYDKSKAWIGQFIDEDTAKAWLKKTGRDESEHEISRRRPERRRDR